MSQLKDRVQQLSKEYFEETRATRRHIHANPELSFKEFKTAAFVADKLKALGITPTEGVAGTGLVATIEGKNPQSKVVALRADMDALPIVEANDVPYKSTVEGVMHACGHDVHTSSLLGVAKILTELKDEFEGTVKLIFQPGEETAPGGASIMIKEGALQNPAPSKIIGQHVLPQMPTGKVGFRSGKYMASADEIYFTVHGKGGHGAMPELCIDPVLVTSHIIVALQQIVSRNASPKMPSVLTIGKVIANGATNVIPNKVEVAGTFRTFNEEWREKALQTLSKMATSIAEGMGATCEMNIVRGYPFLVNEPKLTAQMRAAAVEFMGAENVVDLDLWLAAEDFAYYSQQMDACFYRLGTGNVEKGITSGVHTPTFDIDEQALITGQGLMTWLALSELQNK